MPALLLWPACAMADTLDRQIDAFFGLAFGWFVRAIFYSVRIGEVQFPLIAGWLMLAALVFTVYFGVPQLRGSRLAIDLLRGRHDPPHGKARGEVTHFQALTTALSGTVGLGNIAGVGAALAVGGPGATFWMIVVGLLGMASKFTECTLGVKYRVVHADGSVSGGPMYYLRDGLAERGMPRLGRLLAALFAVFVVLGSWGGGNMFQGNQAHAMIVGTFGVANDHGWLTGLVLAVIVYLVISGGMPSIARVTSRLVPWMAALYIGMALIALAVHAARIPEALGAILDGAFRAEGVAGGVLGAMIQGLRRATFSNEAGVGSAAIAHSAVRTDEPVTEGLVALLEPFIDTVVICTVTALVITTSGLNLPPYPTPGGLTGVDLTAAALQQTSPAFRYPLALAIILFALSTMITWAYYGLKGWSYLFGNGRVATKAFQLLFCLFVVVGTAIGFGAVIDFSDAAIFAMSIANIIGLYLLAPVVRREYRSFLAKIRATHVG